MGNISHRNNDSRICGAVTVVVLQDFVKVDGELWAVDGDPNNHGDGGLIHSQDYVFISGILVILRTDQARPDDFCPIPPHCDPFATTGDDLVTVE